MASRHFHDARAVGLSYAGHNYLRPPGSQAEARVGLDLETVFVDRKGRLEEVGSKTVFIVRALPGMHVVAIYNQYAA